MIANTTYPLVPQPDEEELQSLLLFPFPPPLPEPVSDLVTQVPEEVQVCAEEQQLEEAVQDPPFTEQHV